MERRVRGPVPIRVEGLTKAYGDVLAVDALSFRAEPGRVTGFLGPNGAGKSTTLRMLLGLVGPTAGAGWFGDRAYAALPSPGRTVGALLTPEQFHPGRSGRGHLRVVAAAAGLPDRRVDEVLALVELDGAARRRVGGYSLGMRQRLGLATALLGDPDVLVLDEPANGLDPAGMRWLRATLRGFAAEGGTVLVSSHLLDEVAHLADEAVVVTRGRLVTSRPVADLVGGADGVEARTPEPERLRAALARAGISSLAEGADGVVAFAGPQEVGAVAAAAGVVLVGLAERRRSLTDVFLQLTGQVEAPTADPSGQTELARTEALR